jgi:hypothetical protein
MKDIASLFVVIITFGEFDVFLRKIRPSYVQKESIFLSFRAICILDASCCLYIVRSSVILILLAFDFSCFCCLNFDSLSSSYGSDK